MEDIEVITSKTEDMIIISSNSEVLIEDLYKKIDDFLTRLKIDQENLLLDRMYNGE